MSLLSTELTSRSGSMCELCGSKSSLMTYIVAPKTGINVDDQVAICDSCSDQLSALNEGNNAYWRCLNDTIWSTIPAVQVVMYRTLQAINTESWAQDLVNMIYLDDETQEWADAVDQNSGVHKDSNNNILVAGDTVVLIKDLDVKGANFVAKRGTAVRRITLVHDNVEQIEGKVNDQHIVILTKYVKKSM